MRGAAWLCVGPLFLLAACGQTAEERRAETLAQDRTIAPGYYGNVAIGEESGDPGGYEIHLPQGSDSSSAEFAICQGDCSVVTVEPRRGLGGISFVVPGQAGAPELLYALRPEDRGLELVISGDGATEESQRLQRIEGPAGIAIAKGEPFEG